MLRPVSPLPQHSFRLVSKPRGTVALVTLLALLVTVILSYNRQLFSFFIPSSKSDASVQFFLTQFKNHQLPPCTESLVENDFGFDTYLSLSSSPPIVHFAITRLCSSSSRSSFKVFTSGSGYTAVPPHLTVLHSYQRIVSGQIPMYDSGELRIHCRLQSYNLSDSTVLIADYLKQEEMPSHNGTDRQWRDKDVQQSPKNITIPQYVTRPMLPLCFADLTANFTLVGRWLGVEDPEVFVPYYCSLDRSSTLLDAVKQVKWFHLVGDSVGRSAFNTWCDEMAGVAYRGPPEFRYWDFPQMCLVDSGNAVLTYSHWLTHKQFLLHAELSFQDNCQRYTEDPDVIVSQNTMFGWANCSLAPQDVQHLAGPGLTLFMWGSHGAELGDNNRTFGYFANELFAHEYFKTFPTLISFVPDVDVSRIPAKFGDQFVYRNNERIEAQNQLIIRAVRSHWRDYPLWYTNSVGDDISGFSPFFDVFNPTHSASEFLHGDAVHFRPVFEHEMGTWIAHWVKHAPQTDAKFVRKKGVEHNTVTTKTVGFIL